MICFPTIYAVLALTIFLSLISVAGFSITNLSSILKQVFCQQKSSALFNLLLTTKDIINNKFIQISKIKTSDFSKAFID